MAKELSKFIGHGCTRGVSKISGIKPGTNLSLVRWTRYVKSSYQEWIAGSTDFKKTFFQNPSRRGKSEQYLRLPPNLPEKVKNLVTSRQDVQAVYSLADNPCLCNQTLKEDATAQHWEQNSLCSTKIKKIGALRLPRGLYWHARGWRYVVSR